MTNNRFLFSGKILLLMICFLPFQQSCTDLDEEVFSQLTEETFPTTDEQFISALGATYTSLYGYLNHNSILSLNQISSDETMIPQRGNDWFDGGQWLRVHRHSFNANEEAVNNGWNFLYGGVNNCNRVIALFEGLVADGSVEADDAQAFIAEVRGLRALFYYWLLDSYGNVPLVVDFAGADTAPANNTRQEVYDFVLGELNEIIPVLTDVSGGAAYARFNQWTGYALRAKLYLNSEVYTGTAQWSNAAADCAEIINSGLFALESDYFANFNTDNAGSGENIFVIPYDEAQARGFNLAQMTLHYSSQATFDLQQQPWNGYCTLQEFYDSYDDTDLRKGEFGNQQVRGNFHAGPQFASDGSTRLTDSSAETDDPDGPELTFTPEVNELEPNALRQAGARIGKYEFTNGATPELSNDFPIFRYADILLMRSEALWQMNNGDSEALMLVNEIRSRAGLDGFSALNPDDLLAERGREMFHEGWRRQDLIRFGKFGDAWWEKPASEECKELFPIPQPQINVNTNLSQNDCF